MHGERIANLCFYLRPLCSREDPKEAGLASLVPMIMFLFCLKIVRYGNTKSNDKLVMLSLMSHDNYTRILLNNLRLFILRLRDSI